MAGFHPLKTRMTRWIRRLDRRRRGVKMPADGARADQIRSADSRCADLRVSGYLVVAGKAGLPIRLALIGVFALLALRASGLKRAEVEAEPQSGHDPRRIDFFIDVGDGYGLAAGVSQRKAPVGASGYTDSA